MTFIQYLEIQEKKLKNLDSVYPRLLHLPCGWWVTKKDISKIIKTINDF